MMDLVTTKVIAMSVLGCVSLVIGFAPLKLSRIMGWSGAGRHSKRKDAITSILLCFGGGVLLSTSMIHMLPEVRKGMTDTSQDDPQNDHKYHKTEVPYAEITLCCGFLLVYFIEELVLALAKEEEISPLQKTFSMRASKKRKTTRPIVATVKGSDVEDNEKTQDKTNGVHSHHNELNKNSSIAKSSQTSSNTSTIEIAPANGSNVEQRADNAVVDSNKESYIETITDGNNGATTTTSGGSLFDNLNTDSPSGYNPKYEGKMKRSGAESMFPNYHPTHENNKMQKSLRRHNMSIANACTSLKNLAEEHCICIPCNKSKPDEGEDSPKRSDSVFTDDCIRQCGPGSMRDFVTVLSLSFHSIFEGLAVGLETSTENVWKLFAAIATHKFVITFCIGLELVGGNNQRVISTCAYIIYMVTFILVSPFGIAIGIGISELSGVTSTVNDNAFIDTIEASHQHHIIISVLQGLAAGTILYIVVFEVLLREKSKRVPGLLQFLFIVLGFTAMLLVNVYVGHTHGGTSEIENSNNPELLHPEIHFHPTHLHNTDAHSKVDMNEDQDDLGSDEIYENSSIYQYDVATEVYTNTSESPNLNGNPNTNDG